MGRRFIIRLKELLLSEQSRLTKVKEKAQKELESAPEGTLRLGRSQGCVQYYYCVPGGTHNGSYIPKKKMEFIKQLAQKAYNERVLRLADKRLSQLNRLLWDFEEDEIERIYYEEHPERQRLIDPIEPTFQQKLEQWMNIPYKGKEFKENAPLILTNRGMRVRSKSEKIMADFFDSLGIVYKYECPLYLKPYGYVYPDFTFLSRITGEEIYWEHEGMMDNIEYAGMAVKKIEAYEMNGIFPGENLILTFETSSSVLNTNILKKLVEKYLQ